MQDAPAPSQRARLAACLVFIALVAGGCTWYAWTPKVKLKDPDGSRATANELALGAVHEDVLHCDDGDCQDWFYVEVDRVGELEIVVTTPPQEAAGALRLVLEDALPDGRPRNHSTGWDDASPIRIRASALPRPYFFFVEGDSGPVHFQVVATVDDPRPAGPEGAAPSSASGG